MEPLKRLNTEFHQLDLEEVECEIEKLRNCIPFCANVDIENGLLDLASKVGKVNKTLALEITNLAKTVFMPQAVRQAIFAKLDDVSQARLMCTNTIHRDLVHSTPKFWLKLLQHRVFHEVIARKLLNPDLISESSYLDLEKLEITLRGKSDPDYQEVLCCYLIELAAIDPDVAFARSKECINWDLRERVIDAVLETVVRRDVEAACALVTQVENNAVRAELLAKIACVVYPTDPERARVICREALNFALLADQKRDFTLYMIIYHIKSFDYKMALEAADMILGSKKKDHSCHNVAWFMASKNPKKALKIADLCSTLKYKIKSRVEVAKIVMKTDEELAKRILKEAIDDASGDEDLLSLIIPVLALVDFEEALRMLDQTGQYKDECLSKICLYIPDKALELMDKIESKPWYNLTLRLLIESILPGDISGAFDLVGKARIDLNDFYFKDEQYCKIAAAQADTDFFKALGIAHFIKNRRNRAEALVQIAIKNCFDKTKASELVNEALELMREEFYGYHAILKNIKNHLNLIP